MQSQNPTAQYEKNAMPHVGKSPQVGVPRAEISRTPYQQYVWNDGCAEQLTCTVHFDVVPANSRLEITNVSCYVYMRGPAVVLKTAQLLVIGTDKTIVTASTFAPTMLFTPPMVWSANHAVQVFADAGQHFQGFFERIDFLISWQFVACHISGDLVKLQ